MERFEEEDEDEDEDESDVLKHFGRSLADVDLISPTNASSKALSRVVIVLVLALVLESLAQAEGSLPPTAR